MNIPNVIKRRVKIPKQRSFMWLGAFMDSMYMSLPMVSIINFISIQTVLYANVIVPILPGLSFPLFILCMIGLVFCVMIVAFKFVIPSLWVWRGKQLYGHQSILMDRVQQARDEIKEVRDLADSLQTELTNFRDEVVGLIEKLKEEEVIAP